MIGVRDGMREVKVPMAQAIVRALAVNAVKGQQRAQRLFTELLITTEREKRREQYESAREPCSTTSAAGTVSSSAGRQLGIIAPEPVPHPDHIRIDLRRRHVRDQRADDARRSKADLEVWRRYRQVFVVGNESLDLAARRRS